MGANTSFEEKDRVAALNFIKAAKEASVNSIIYLGGLGEGALSPHLRSRQEVGQELRSFGVEVIEFRASIVIGSGSLSFEIIRALVERLPIMICPQWVAVAAQPIGIGTGAANLRENLLHVLRQHLAQVQQQGVYRPRGGIRKRHDLESLGTGSLGRRGLRRIEQFF